MANDRDRPWRFPVAVDDIPEAGAHYELVPETDTREAIAKVAGLRSLPHLEASFDLTRRGAGITVTGDVRARVGQTCVVTLDPIENDVTEAVDLVFVAPVTDAELDDKPSRTADEPPEPLQDGVVDLGVVATEFLILGLDPYPRKPGAEFVQPAPAEPGAHPFAALEALKKQP